MDAESIAKKARKSISEFCYNECHAYCCRKGYLVMSKTQANKVTNRKRAELEKGGILKRMDDGNYSLYMGKSDQPCPSLDGFKCTIHKSKLRPLTCSLFPIFIEGKAVKLSNRCPAVKMGMFYPYIERWMALGYKIIGGNILCDSDFFERIKEKKD